MGALRAGFHGTVGQPSAQVIDGSLKFDSGATNYLKKTPYVGNRKTWTISFWVKRSEGTSNEPGIFSTFAGSNPAFTCYFNAQDNLRIYEYTSTYVCQLITDQVFRDYNSWYHIVISADTTSSSPDVSDRLKVYVNGVRVTDFDTATVSYPGSNVELDWNTAYEHNIGKHVNTYDGNISNFYHIDGHSFGPEYFGFTDPLTNTWRPKKLEQFPKRSFTNPRWYSSATVYTSVADVVANATDRGNGGVTVTNEYCYLVFNDGGYGTSGGESASPDYPVWTDVASFSGSTRVFYYDSNEADNWANAASYNSSASEWNQWRYSNASSYDAYRISPYMDIENGNMLVFCANATADNPTNAGTLASITLPTFDTNSFHFQNAAVDTWYTGGNSFYLPFDGNSPIGKDKFNNGNDWTPVRFGGSNTIEKAIGALPILNTTDGGNTATVGVRTDAYASNLVLALPLVGIVTDVSNQINSGSTTKSVAENNNIGPSDAQSNFYEGSFYFDGNATETSATYLEVASGLNFSQDFTVEMWFYKTTTQEYGVLFDCWNGQTSGDGWYSWIAGGRIDTVKDGSTYYYGSGDSVIVDDTWNHVAYVRDNNVFKVFSNGVFQYSFDITDSWTSTKCWIGSGQGNGSMAGFYGYIQDVRIYETAKYTENFIPASTNPDILPDTPSGVSGSSKLTKITDGAVYFDGTGDYLEIADNTDFELGTGDFTIEAFIYNSVDAVQSIIAKYDNGNSVRSFWLGTITSNNIAFYWYSGNNVYSINGGVGTLPSNKWSHVVAQRTSGDIYLFLDGKIVSSDTGADAAVSLNDTTYALRIGSDTHQQGLEFEGYISNVRIVKGTGVYNTSGFTPPTAPLTNVTNTTLLCCQSNKLAGTAAVSPNISGGLNDGTVWSEEGQSVNVGASTPMAYAFDGDTTSYVLPVDNTTMRYDFPFLITGTKFEMRVAVSLNINGFSVNGQSSSNVTASTGGPVWVDVTDAVTASGLGGLSYITMGYLASNWSQVVYAFRVDDVILVDPVSAVNAKASTLNPFNTDINTVRGQETNHCTWNPLHNIGTFPSTYEYSNGNLDFTTSGSPNIGGVATIGVKSGRWYWEIIHTQLATNTYDTATYVAYDTFNRFTARDRGIAYLANGQKKMNDVNTDYGATYTTNDVIGVALDADNDKVTYFKNGKSQGELSITHLTPNTGYYPAIHQVNGSNNLTGSANFGQKPFKFPPPDGYQPLNDANVRPETVIARPDQYVGVTTYPGTALTQSINHFNFKPDLAWIKVTDNQRSNFLFDSVRGAENYLISDSTGIQVNDSTTLTSFDLNGFTVGTSPDVNRDTSEIVAWAWKAGGDSNTFNVDDVGYATAADAGLTAGDITPTGASVGTKQGFSIIRWTAPTWNGSPQTVPHGLTQAPSFMITKVTDDIASWYCYHKDLDATNPEDYYITLNNSDGRDTLTNAWGTNPPDNTTFGDRQLGWGNGKDVIAYIWHDVPGLQKFGTYQNNTHTNGPYIDLGFKPALFVIKRIDTGSTGEWWVYDGERNPINLTTANVIRWNSPEVETETQTNYAIDFLSNGFKIRNNSNDINASANSVTYIYAAWAESPAINLYGATSNAR